MNWNRRTSNCRKVSESNSEISTKPLLATNGNRCAFWKQLPSISCVLVLLQYCQASHGSQSRPHGFFLSIPTSPQVFFLNPDLFCRFHLVCLGKNFGDRNFSYAWYKLKLICVLRVGLSKVPLLKSCTLVLSVVFRKYLSTLQNFSAVSAVLSSAHGLICAFRGPRLGGFHPVPGTWIVREDLSLVQFELYQGTGWNPPSPWILKHQLILI